MPRRIPVLPFPSAAPGSTDFLWATGIEDTFIAQPDPRTGRILDEYALTQHYERWEEDLALIASLGVPCARYGIPWHRVEPRPGAFDWAWTDRVLDTLINRHGVEPIVDLMHYGTPGWLQGSFLSPEYPARVAEYARAFAEQYQGLCYWYTPLNEPRINAWFAARLGWWPPYKRSWRSFAQMLAALARGIVETQRAVAAVEPNAVFVHVDATDLYLADTPDMEAEARLRQEIVFCALDLIQGRVTPESALGIWLQKQEIAPATLEWFAHNTARPNIIGYNMYPMYSEKRVRRAEGGGVAVQIRRCGAETFAALTRMYAERYGLPVMCTETASNGPPWQRIRWIAESAQQVSRLRADGVPVVGYTYWPLFSLVGWPYARGERPRKKYLIHMGLWDLRSEDTGALRRVETQAADAYRARVAAPVLPLGAATLPRAD